MYAYLAPCIASFRAKPESLMASLAAARLLQRRGSESWRRMAAIENLSGASIKYVHESEGVKEKLME